MLLTVFRSFLVAVAQNRPNRYLFGGWRLTLLYIVLLKDYHWVFTIDTDILTPVSSSQKLPRQCFHGSTVAVHLRPRCSSAEAGWKTRDSTKKERNESKSKYFGMVPSYVFLCATNMPNKKQKLLFTCEEIRVSCANSVPPRVTGGYAC